MIQLKQQGRGRFVFLCKTTFQNQPVIFYPMKKKLFCSGFETQKLKKYSNTAFISLNFLIMPMMDAVTAEWDGQCKKVIGRCRPGLSEWNWL